MKFIVSLYVTYILFCTWLTEPNFKQGSNTDNNRKENPNTKNTTKQNNDTNKQPLSHCDQRHPGNSILRDALMYIVPLQSWLKNQVRLIKSSSCPFDILLMLNVFPECDFSAACSDLCSESLQPATHKLDLIRSSCWLKATLMQTSLQPITFGFIYLAWAKNMNVRCT